MTADTVLRLQDRFRMTARFWMHLQADWDLQIAIRERRPRTRKRMPSGAAASALRPASLVAPDC
jgi:plasmid maintenance system antidote protein VapI